ncbi:sensor histidine kinase [Croceiramulus getboli]|nr:ATP-binding protein [Flavobacteriaceae bacterium YJPT1-3]
MEKITTSSVILSDLKIGLWQLDSYAKKYLPQDSVRILFDQDPSADLESFLNSRVNKKHLYSFQKHLDELRLFQNSFQISAQLDETYGRKWYLFKGAIAPENNTPIVYCHLDEVRNDTRLREKMDNRKADISKNEFYLQEMMKLTKTGGWYVDLVENTIEWDDMVKEIHGVSKDFIPDLESGINFYHPEHVPVITQLFNRCAVDGEPFNRELKLVDLTGKTIWVQSIGFPVRDNDRNIIAVRGVFRDINDRKKRELALEWSNAKIQSQHTRFTDFAYIISHNLRSHVSNLELSTSLFNQQDLNVEQGELFNIIKTSSQGLDKTLRHLNEVIAIQSKTEYYKEEIKFEEVLSAVQGALMEDIKKYKVEITYDFSEVPTLYYERYYMYNILENLLSNAIKYRHKGKSPRIDVRTYLEDDKVLLLFSDNGLGIDLEMHKDRMFRMYSSLHGNSDSEGVGLFMVKNQVEALGGTISVASEVNVGTTFTIQF